jgi:hypothetical protein
MCHIGSKGWTWPGDRIHGTAAEYACARLEMVVGWPRSSWWLIVTKEMLNQLEIFCV